MCQITPKINQIKVYRQTHIQRQTDKKTHVHETVTASLTLIEWDVT